MTELPPLINGPVTFARRGALEARSAALAFRAGMLAIEPPKRTASILRTIERLGQIGAAIEIAAMRHGERAGLVDELVLHQVPILLGGGCPFFQELHEHVRLRLLEVIPAPGGTHLRYEVVR